MKRFTGTVAARSAILESLDMERMPAPVDLEYLELATGQRFEPGDPSERRQVAYSHRMPRRIV